MKRFSSLFLVLFISCSGLNQVEENLSVDILPTEKERHWCIVNYEYLESSINGFHKTYDVPFSDDTRNLIISYWNALDTYEEIIEDFKNSPEYQTSVKNKSRIEGLLL